MTHLLNAEKSWKWIGHFIQECQEQGFITMAVILRIQFLKNARGKCLQLSASLKQPMWCIQAHLVSFRATDLIYLHTKKDVVCLANSKKGKSREGKREYQKN